MKSAIGIGALLMDGLGDTIRVSLTEDPEYEMDPCRWGFRKFRGFPEIMLQNSFQSSAIPGQPR